MNKTNSCPRCSTEFEGIKCSNCGWNKPLGKDEQPNMYCNKCNRLTALKYKGQLLCASCYSDEWGKDYKPSATTEQLNMFLISMGRKSRYWEKAGKEKQDAAIDYYRQHREEVLRKIEEKKRMQEIGKV